MYHRASSRAQLDHHMSLMMTTIPIIRLLNDFSFSNWGSSSVQFQLRGYWLISGLQIPHNWGRRHHDFYAKKGTIRPPKSKLSRHPFQSTIFFFGKKRKLNFSFGLLTIFWAVVALMHFEPCSRSSLLKSMVKKKMRQSVTNTTCLFCSWKYPNSHKYW